MAKALIDIDADIFNGDPENGVVARDIGAIFSTMRTFGLRVAGSAPSPLTYIDGPAPVRLIVEDPISRSKEMPR
jgi:hypothetical protein